MKTITELKKERLTMRTLDPVRSTVLGMLIDGATKIAKEERREPNEKDIELCAKRSLKEAEKDIEIYIESNRVSENDTARADNLSAIATLRIEIGILQEFVPIEMNEVEIRKLINEMPVEILTKKNMGSIMKEMKKIEHMNVSLLFKILNEVLK